MTVQRTGASRRAEWRCGGPGWLAPVADLCVRFPDQDPADRRQTPNDADVPGPHPQTEMTTIQAEADMASGTGHARLAWESHSGAYMRLIELDGPANGRQPTRRVAMRRLPAAGSRR